MTLNDLKDFYTANFTSFAKMAMASFPREWGVERREEATQEVLAGVWRTLQRHYVLGDVTEDNIYWMAKKILYHGITQVLGGRMMPQNAEHGRRGQNRQDAYDKMQRFTLKAGIDFVVGSSPVDEAVAFRIDFSACVETLSERDREVIAAMIYGLGTGEIAERFGLTAGRISQLRMKYKKILDSFFSE